jgi:hypothetical protein
LMVLNRGVEENCSGQGSSRKVFTFHEVLWMPSRTRH